MEWECNNNNMTMLWRRGCGAREFENAESGKGPRSPLSPFFVYTHPHKIQCKRKTNATDLSFIFRI